MVFHELATMLFPDSLTHVDMGHHHDDHDAMMHHVATGFAKADHTHGDHTHGDGAEDSKHDVGVKAAGKEDVQAATTPEEKIGLFDNPLPNDKPEVRVDLLNNNNSQYYGDFMLGTPPKPFTAVLDTGSGVIWVPGIKCKSHICQEGGHNLFDGAKSSTYKAPEETRDETTPIQYGTGSVHYQLGNDTLRFCDSKLNANCRNLDRKALTIPHQPFGITIHQSSEPFKWLPFDGILGLAPSENPASVLHFLKKSGALKKMVMGAYLSEDTHRVGSLSLGGIEPQYIAKGHPLYWHQSTAPGEWQVDLKDIEVDGKPLHLCDKRPGGICPAVVDTGSSLLSGPSDAVDKITKLINVDKKCKNLNKMPGVDVVVKSGGNLVRYPLQPKDYVLQTINDTTDDRDCELGIGPMNVPGNKFVIGDTFLRRYYSIYDDDRNAIGFVRSVHAGETTPPAQPLSDAEMEKTRIAASSMSLFSSFISWFPQLPARETKKSSFL